MEEAGWPNEAGIVAVSLGRHDGLVAWKSRWTLDSGEMILFGEAAVKMKECLSWPTERDWLMSPDRWLTTFEEGIPAGRRLIENIRAVFKASDCAW